MMSATLFLHSKDCLANIYSLSLQCSQSLYPKFCFPQHLPLIARDSWGPISKAMMKNPSTGTPLMAIFFFGDLMEVSRA